MKGKCPKCGASYYGGFLETRFTRNANNVETAWKYQRVKYHWDKLPGVELSRI